MSHKTENSAAAQQKSLREAQRDARLKVALKANMARRKAQTKARSGPGFEADDATNSVQDGADNNENE